MANLVERRTFNIFGIFDSIGEHFNTGDPAVKDWFLVKSNFWPIFLCCMYLLTIKVIGPSIMRDRKPFELRKVMLIYNLFLVVAYTVCVSIVLYCIRNVDNNVLCKNTTAQLNSCTYKMATCGWIIYLLKYVEFLDTILFVLRKKDHLITNLHVIHHFVLPLCGWVLFRTERSGFQAYPIITNSIVHIAMYSYYGLAAMGPSVRKYLWWKRYLTIAQMIQFIIIFLFVTVIMPLTGCTATKTSVFINVTAAILFFSLFYNFYQHSFKPKKVPEANKKAETDSKNLENNVAQKKIPSGECGTNGYSKVKCN